MKIILFLSDVFLNVWIKCLIPNKNVMDIGIEPIVLQLLEKDLDIIDIGKELLRRYEYKSKELSLAVHTYQVTNCLRVYLTEPGDEDLKTI